MWTTLTSCIASGCREIKVTILWRYSTSIPISAKKKHKLCFFFALIILGSGNDYWLYPCAAGISRYIIELWIWYFVSLKIFIKRRNNLSLQNLKSLLRRFFVSYLLLASVAFEPKFCYVKKMLPTGQRIFGVYCWNCQQNLIIHVLQVLVRRATNYRGPTSSRLRNMR